MKRYLEAVFPRSIGVRRHPLFPIFALIEKIKSKKDNGSQDDADEVISIIIIKND